MSDSYMYHGGDQGATSSTGSGATASAERRDESSYPISSPIAARPTQPVIPPRSALRPHLDTGRLRSNSYAVLRSDSAGLPSTPGSSSGIDGSRTPPSAGHAFSRSYSHTLTPPASSSTMESTDSRDVFAAVRGLRGDQMPMRGGTPPLSAQSPVGELSFAPEGYMDGEGERERATLSFGNGRGQRALYDMEESEAETEVEEDPEADVLARIKEAVSRSRDQGDTLDLSRKGISTIGPLAIQQFRRGVGQDGKGVWR